MIRKILALSLVLLAVSMVFSGCKSDPEPVEVTPEVTVEKAEPAIEGVVEDHSGHNH